MPRIIVPPSDAEGAFLRVVETPDGGAAVESWDPDTRSWERGRGFSWWDAEMGRRLSPEELAAFGVTPD